MDRRERDAVFQCTGAIVGAGFASGREIMRFFSRYGSFSWIGISLAAAVMGIFAYALMKKAREANVISLSQLCRAYLGSAGIAGTISFTILLGATGGSMSAAAGELGALSLPIHGAYWIVLFAALTTGILLSSRGLSPLAFVGRFLIPSLILIFLLCLIPPEGKAVTSQTALPVWQRITEVVLFGISYGAMNITLAAGVLCEIGRGVPRKKALHISIYLAICVVGLLSLGNIVLLRQPQLINAALPMVMLLNSFGKVGFWLAIIGLFLAVYTTLMAAARGMINIIGPCKPGWLCFVLTGILFFVFAAIGFDKLVGIIYPVLGIMCLLLLVWISATGKYTGK